MKLSKKDIKVLLFLSTLMISLGIVGIVVSGINKDDKPKDVVISDNIVDKPQKVETINPSVFKQFVKSSNKFVYNKLRFLSENRKDPASNS